MGKPRPDGKPPSERILALAYVSAPRMKREGDEVIIFVGFAYSRRLRLRQESI